MLLTVKLYSNDSDNFTTGIHPVILLYQCIGTNSVPYYILCILTQNTVTIREKERVRLCILYKQTPDKIAVRHLHASTCCVVGTMPSQTFPHYTVSSVHYTQYDCQPPLHTTPPSSAFTLLSILRYGNRNKQIQV